MDGRAHPGPSRISSLTFPLLFALEAIRTGDNLAATVGGRAVLDVLDYYGVL